MLAVRVALAVHQLPGPCAPLPRCAGVTNARYLLLGASTPWKRVKFTRGFGASVASFATILTLVFVPTLYAVFFSASGEKTQHSEC